MYLAEGFTLWRREQGSELKRGWDSPGVGDDATAIEIAARITVDARRIALNLLLVASTGCLEATGPGVRQEERGELSAPASLPLLYVASIGAIAGGNYYILSMRYAS